MKAVVGDLTFSTKAEAEGQLALDDPGVISDGIRDRAMRAVLERGHEPEDPEKTRRSQEFWTQFRAPRTRP